MPFGAEPLTLVEDERRELQQMMQSRMLPAGDVLRARMILLLAEGVSYQKIQDVALRCMRFDWAMPSYLQRVDTYKLASLDSAPRERLEVSE
jgi:hypothetical protein